MSASCGSFSGHDCSSPVLSPGAHISGPVLSHAHVALSLPAHPVLAGPLPYTGADIVHLVVIGVVGVVAGWLLKRRGRAAS